MQGAQDLQELNLRVLVMGEREYSYVQIYQHPLSAVEHGILFEQEQGE